ncbi:MAG TPA: ABC transporter ATP-binding protein [Papillibacter sp.]|nr:ABC transporter ATP-binding protein [Papillibacter sp.]
MSKYVLNVVNVSKTFSAHQSTVEAVKNVSLHVGAGECVGLVGESGCGKSTLARLITRLEPVDTGEISLCGEKISHLCGAALRRAYRNVKMIFQDPRSSFDPRMTIGASIREAIKASTALSRRERAAESVRLLCEVGLDASYDRVYPRQISGGECQRAAIARAIGAKPRLLICDEATSALDVSVQAQILDLLRTLRRQQDMAFLFISHDLALVSSFCDRTYVMRGGEIVEHGPTGDIIARPKHPYTQKLIGSILAP